ncbi:MAG: hypothetical protein JXA95_00730 [Spirochaetales bacterium]|nr:hypothetical protein [Spirochaetales bacterium]
MVKQHSRYQVEFKHHYPLSRERNNGYILDIFLLSPFTLDIRDSTYSRQEILSDTHIYTRYTIYRTTLEDLLDRNNRVSPLIRLENMLGKNRIFTTEENRLILYEFRVLANVFLELMDDKENRIKELIQTIGPSPALKGEVILFYERLEEILSRFRALRIPEKNHGRYGTQIGHAFLLADELISLTVESVLAPLLSLFNDAEGATGKKRIRKLLLREIEYRRSRNYAVLDGDDQSEENRERTIYRESILKKWAHSVNYMDNRDSSLNRNTSQLLAAVAAAVAMAFAVIATLYANRFFVTYSLPWILIAVLSYSLKDRIKEGLRAIFKRIIPVIISDRTDNLYDNLVSRPVGRARLSVEHMKMKDLPADIARFYGTEGDALKSILRPANVLHLRRRVRIYGKKLTTSHVRLNSLTEVFRLNLFRFTRNMDDPEKKLWYLEGEIPLSLMGSRAYRLKVAVKVTDNQGSVRNAYYKVHMRQDGITKVVTMKEYGE